MTFPCLTMPRIPALRRPVNIMAQALAAALLMQTGSAHALGLLQAYQEALQHDPTYISAKFENDAGQENKAIGRSSLLPALSASYAQSKNQADITNKGIGGPGQTTTSKYKSASGSISLHQSIINFDGVARYRQGVAQAQSSSAIFTSRSQDLMLRVVAAYVEVLFSTEQLTLAIAQRDTLIEQKRVNDRMFLKGEGTRTDVLETQARLDLAEAQVVETRDAQGMARSTLGGIVGHDIGQVDGLANDFRPQPLQPADFSSWKTLAVNNNAELQAQTYAIEVARQEIKKSRAGHAPRLDFVASYSKNDAETITNINNSSNVSSIGLQLSIPLYSGGYVNATSNQAVANFERAKADYQVRENMVLNDLQHQHSLTLSSVARIDALIKAVESGRLLIQATQQSIKGGVRINLDLLNARQQYYSAQRDLAQARYNYLQAYLHLRFQSGMLVGEDINKMAGFFTATR